MSPIRPTKFAHLVYRTSNRGIVVFIGILIALLAACRPAPTPTEATSSTAMARPASGLASVNDTKLYYETYGEGAPLILLHGGLSHIEAWKNQLSVLAKQYKVIAVDSRGHGRSSFSEQPISYALMATDVLALMDYLGIKKAHLLGWSDGAIIGLHLAINHPERINKLIAYGANYNPAGLRPDAMENKKLKDYFEQAAKDYQSLSPTPARFEAFQKNMMHMWETEPNFTTAQLRSITVPTLILDGENEEAILTKHTQELAGFIPQSQLIFIPGTGHFAPQEKPEAFNKIVLDFLAGTGANLPMATDKKKE
jgi:pimeloyl-ACP methyl ester carboxylesterase